MKSLGKGETAWLRAEKLNARPFYLGSVTEAIRRSQYVHWGKHGDGPDWEREFYGPPPFFLGGDPPGPGGFLRSWCEVFGWYRAEAEYRLRSMRDAYAAAKLAFLGEAQRLQDLTEEKAVEGMTRGSGVSLFAPTKTLLAQLERLGGLAEEEPVEGTTGGSPVERLRGPAEEEAVEGTTRGSPVEFFAWVLAQPKGEFPDGVGLRVSHLDAARVFWEFEAFAQNVRSVLDTLVRLVAPSYPQAIPVSISRFSKRNFTGEVAAELKAAWVQWGHRLGEYRDCVVHYTPLKVDLFAQGRKVGGEWRVPFYLPDNPSARHLEKFQFARQVDVLLYSEGVLKNLDSLSCRIGGLLLRLWRHDLYPIRQGPYFA